ncbi:MAG: Na+/H+ antiporter NhaA, partial [Planctomycetales bacterium]|nr:Na+/H+ antiporter NhaA [Planctomycetales bacterium]
MAFLFENSLFLVFGAVAALVWANVDQHSYHNFVHFDLKQVISDRDGAGSHGHGEPGAAEEHADEDHAGDAHTDAEGSHEGDDDHDGEHAAEEGEGGHDAGGHGNASGGLRWPHLTVHFLINDILMALFFAIAGKEVWESLLPGGARSNVRKAATPLLATAGGVLGPVVVYLTGCALTDTWADLSRGWAVPCATDIAFSYLVARLVFGAGHPAIAFLLLLAIADDAAG